jgi:diguanylate cyclase (GGDEF)-like protein/PAS domain S-box-containing protein
MTLPTILNLIQILPDAAALLDRGLNYITANPAFSALFELPPAESLTGRNHFAAFPDLPADWRDGLGRVRDGALMESRAAVFIRANGQRLHLRVTLRPVRDSADTVCAILIVCADDTAAQARLRAEQADKLRYQYALEGANDGLWDWDVQTGGGYQSPRWFTMLGYAPEAWASSLETSRNLIHPDDVKLTSAALRADLVGQVDRMNVEYRMRHCDGRYRWVLCRGQVVARDADGKALRIVGTHKDISERKALAQQLALLAEHDPLTGLTNRRKFDAALASAVADAQALGRPFAVAVADLDAFKAVNDSYGHDAGDAALCWAAQQLRQGLPEDVLVARLGGDEFAMLFPAAGPAFEADATAQQVQALLHGTVTVDGQSFAVSGSAGAAHSTACAGHVHEVLKAADQALYQRKRAKPCRRAA